MSLTSQQQMILDRRINQMREDGFFLPSSRSLSGDTRHLIISYGGTGASALFGVKKEFETILPRQELEERVRFLAIDTDKATQKKTQEVVKSDGKKEVVEVDSLSPAQFFQLSGDSAKRLLTNGIDATVATWLNPQLEHTINSDSRYLDGTGASGIRQLGRLTLFPATTVASLCAKIAALVKELSDDNVAPLKVFILTGISGGTGSGTVVDLTYLIRDIIDNLPGGVSERTKYCGFVLMPPTGKSTNSTEIDHGNRNGYAALKEINHFMTLRLRGDRYSFTYGNGRVVDSGDNIFDVCYLMDGVADGKAFGNPMEKVVKVLAEAILDMVTASQTSSDGVTTIQAVDSFMNDAATFLSQSISDQSVTRAMRDADYVYCALGHSEFAMPANEIKAYVGKKLFDRIYELFLRCENVEERDVQEFLNNVIRHGVSTRSQVKKSMDEEITAVFTELAGMKGGPFYTINLLKDAADYVEVIRNKVKLLRPGMVSNEELDNIKAYAIKCNRETFEAYTLAMTALKNLMESQFGSVVHATTNGNVYSFMPVSMGKAGDRAEIIISYLDSLICGSNLRRLTDSLLQELLNNKEKWVALVDTDITAGNTAAAAMRKFWNTQLDSIVQATMEDFLIKYYSGDPDAHYSRENHAATVTYLENAARAIYSTMLGAGGAAQPMVELSPNGLTANDFNGHTYLMVPRCAPNLLQELKKIAKEQASSNDAVKVCESFAPDRISCYKQYSSIPAFKLEWTLRAEEAYEKIILTTAGYGIHMSETAGGLQWKNFPNLLPRSTWPALTKPYRNPREEALDQLAQDLFVKGDKLGLMLSQRAVGGTQNIIYIAQLLPEQYRPDALLYKELDLCREGSDMQKQKLAEIDAAATACAEALYQAVAEWSSPDQIRQQLENAGVKFLPRNLWFPNVIMTVGPTDKNVRPDWDEYMAACMLRKLPTAMYELEGTVVVMEKLLSKVSHLFKAQSLIKRYSQYLCAHLFTYNEELEQWEYEGEDGLPQEFVYLESIVEKSGEYYFMFQRFTENAEEIIKALTEKFNSVNPFTATDPATRKARQKAFKDAAAELKATLADWIKSKPMKPYEQIAKKKGYDPEAIMRFYKDLYKEADEITIAGYIPVETEFDVPADDIDLF